MNRKSQCRALRSKVFVALLALLGVCAAARAEDYPSQNIRIVVPLAPGGGADTVARLIAEFLQEKWKKTVIVENKPGGNGLIGAQEVARAKPDGYTLLLGVPSLTTAKVLLKNPSFDPQTDLVAVSQIMDAPYIVAVNSALPVNNLVELIAYAKANPGKLNYGSVAGGNILAVELFKHLSGADLFHIPYRGSAPAVMALATNDVQVVFDAMITLRPMIEAGKVRAIGVTTADRAPVAPDLPSVKESGVPSYDVSFWFGILAPAGTPAPIQRQIASAVAEFAKLPKIVERFKQLGYLPLGSTPEQFAIRIARESRDWAEAATFAKIEPN